MSMVSYNTGTTTIGINAEEVNRLLGDLANKTPAVLKVAVNATARETRKEMLKKVLARYALTAKGKERAKELVQGKRATNANPSTELRIGKRAGRLGDLAYFQHRVTQAHPGGSWRSGPEYFTARVLKGTAMRALTGGNYHSKGFLAQFGSGHIGMVQRRLYIKSKKGRTSNGYRRWKSASGVVEKTRTYRAPSATAQHKTVWLREHMDEFTKDMLMMRTLARIQWELERAAKKG